MKEGKREKENVTFTMGAVKGDVTFKMNIHSELKCPQNQSKTLIRSESFDAEREHMVLTCTRL